MRIFERYPCLLPAIGVMCGVCFGILHVSLWFVTLPLLIIACLYAAHLYTRRRPSLAWRMRWWRQAVVTSVAVSAGFAADIIHQPEEVDFVHNKDLEYLIGEVREVSHMTYGDRMTVEIEAMCDSLGNHIRPLKNHMAIVTSSDYSAVPHDRLVFANRLKRIVDSPNYQTIGRARSLELQGIMWEQNLREGEARMLSPCTSFMAHCEGLRGKLSAHIERSGLQRPTVAFLLTMLLGENHYLTDDTRHAMADAGISHILAVSGLHTGIIAAMILLITAPLVLMGMRRQRLVAVIILTWVYVLTSGCHVSAVRSAIMVTVVMGALIIERPHSSFNALCLASLIIMLIAPRALLTPAMQLSFVCVGTLLCFGRYNRLLPGHSIAAISKLFSAALTSILAVFGSWALTAYYFHSLPLLFLPVNLIVLPLLPVYLISALAYLTLVVTGLQPAWLGTLLDIGYDSLISLCRLLPEWSVVSVWVHYITPVIWIAGISILGYALSRGGRKSKIAAIACLACGVVSIWLLPGARPKDGIIIRDDSMTVTIASYAGGKEDVAYYHPGRAEALYLYGRKVCLTGVETAAQRHFPDSCDVLIVTKGTRRTLVEMNVMFHPRLVVIHRSVRRDIRERLNDEAVRTGIQIKDIAETGPVRLLDD